VKVQLPAPHVGCATRRLRRKPDVCGNGRRGAILANSRVADRISDVYQAKIDKWKGILGSAATSHAVPISKYDDNFIRFDNSRIEIMKNIQGDTDENSMLWFPRQKTLIAGDIVFNDRPFAEPA
jgi:hypothetical protein